MATSTRMGLRPADVVRGVTWLVMFGALAAGCGGDDAEISKATDDVAIDTDGAEVADAGDLDAAASDGSDGGGSGHGDVIGPGTPCTTPVDCDDALDACQQWVCDSKLGCVAVWAPADAVCIPGDACVISGRCVGGACKAEAFKDCDDGVPCTADTCADGTCVHLPIEASEIVACDDGNPCTGGDHCAAGACVAGANQCACSTDTDCAGLSKGNLCTGTYYCAVVAPGVRQCVLNPATVVACSADADTLCQRNTCDPALGTCSMVATPEGGACNDGEKCTAGEVCTKGVCGGGKPVCCQSDGDCVGADDGDLCNGVMFCNKALGLCIDNPASVVNCPSVDDTTCSTNLCQPKTGKCAMTAAADGVFCDDGNPCTPGDGACKGGQCVSSTNTCACSSDADCASKDDGDLCNGTLYCSVSTGTCAPNPATVVICPTVDDTSCSKNTCAAKTGACVQVPVLDGTPCEGDGSLCTPNDTCQQGKCAVDPTNTCKCKSNKDCTKYDDGDLCNGTMFCDLADASCKVNAATVISCPSADNTQCIQSLCQKQTGKCAMTFVHQNEVCDDGVPCTQGELCTNGACEGGADICLCHKDADCAAKEDGNVCNGTLFCDTAAIPWACQVKPSSVIVCPTVNDTTCQKSTCQPTSGKCELMLQNTDGPCDDDNPCTIGTLCKGSLCLNPDINQDKPCDDNNPCTDDSCDKAFGCVNAANKTPCEDGDLCTAGDTCAGKACVAGKPKVCDDGNTCTTDLCDAKAGCLELQNAAGCSDGNACTLGDACKAGACAAGTAKPCDDGNPCTVDGCEPKTGTCVFDATVPGATICDDGLSCTKDTCDKALGCLHATLSGVCDDGHACTTDACSPQIGCIHLGDDAACDDGSACTQDRCLSGQGCEYLPQADAMPCFDDDACTVGDACKAGKCISGPKAALCDISSDQCKGKADGSACNDGNACTKAEACLGGVCQAPVVSTWTSTWLGTKGVTGNRDGHRLKASVTYPSAIARASDGAMVFASSGTIRRVGLDGAVTTLAGGSSAGAVGSDGPGSAAVLGEIVGLRPRNDGSIWFADGGARTFRAVSTAGVVTTLAGSGAKGFADGTAKTATFSFPSALIERPDGTWLLVDRDAHCIKAWDVKANTVKTWAGACGSQGVVDGSASVARFHGPTAVESLPDGGWVVVDRLGHRIRKVDANGAVVTLAGSSLGYADGKGTAAKFFSPLGAAVTAAGEILVADSLNHRVRRVLLDGSVSTVAGGTPGAVDGAAAQFNVVAAIALNPGGDLIIADAANRLLRRIELRRHACDDGDICTQDACEVQSGDCKMAPVDCDIGDACVIATCEAKTGVCTWTNVVDGSPCDDGDPCTAPQLCAAGECVAAGKLTLHSANDGGDLDGPAAAYKINGVRSMVRAADGGVFMADGDNHVIRRMGPDGRVETVAGTSMGSGAGYQDGPALQARFNLPLGLHIGHDGALYIADYDNYRVRRLGPEGIVTTLAGGPQSTTVDGPAGVARFVSPRAIATNASGTLIVADTMGHRLRAVAADGSVSTWSGSGAGYIDGPIAIARYHRPADLALAKDGSLFVADYFNHLVRRISPTGIVTTVVGRQGINGYVPGSALEASLAYPSSIALDDEGLLWIANWDGALALWSGGRLRTVVRKGTTFTPGIGAGAALGSASSVVALSDGTMLVSDAVSDRIGKVSRPWKTCDDNNPCTIDACQPYVGCHSDAASLPCDDGQACTVGDTCAAGACKPGAKATDCKCKDGPTGGCDDGNPCTTDSCAPAKGCAHVKREDGVVCDDDNACSESSQCLGGACKPSLFAFSVTRLVGSQDGAVVKGIADGARAAVEGKLARADLGEPAGLAVAPDGTLIWTEGGFHALRTMGPDGVARTIAGAATWAGYANGLADGHRLAARFNWPTAVVRSANGTLYLTDTNNHAIRAVTPAGMVTTVAGAIPAAAGFANGSGTNARFRYPYGLSLLGDGALAVADNENHRLRRVGLDGEVTTLAGSGTKGFVDGPAASAALNQPVGIDVSPKGDVYFGDRGNGALRRLRDGVVQTLAGATTSALLDGIGIAGAGVPEVRGVHYDAALDAVFLTSINPGRVRVWTAWGGVVSLLGDGGSSPKGGLGLKTTTVTPRALVKVAPDQYVLAEGDGARLSLVRRVGTSCDDGNPCTTDVCDPKVGCSHKTADPALACPDGGPCQVAACDVSKGVCTYTLAAEGTRCGKSDDCASLCMAGVCRQAALVLPLTSGGQGSADGPVAKASFNQPRGLADDGAGGILVADGLNHRIRRIEANGTVTTVLGSSKGYKEGKGAEAQLSTPAGLERASGGDVYLTDYENHRVRVMSPGFATSLVAGAGAAGHVDGVATVARFNYPRDLALGSDGEIFVADQHNHVIRRIDANGMVATLAGSPGKAGAIDGVGAGARFSYPAAIARAKGGHLYVVDFEYNVVRRVLPSGQVDTVAGRPMAYGAHLDGAGPLGARLLDPTAIEVLADGSLLVGEQYGTLRRVWPSLQTVTVAGESASSGFSSGLGSEARIGYVGGLLQRGDGTVWMSLLNDDRIVQVRLDVSTCKGLAGAAKALAAKDCATIGAMAAYSGLPRQWVDPDGGSKDNAVRTECDHTTAGGGWTRVTAAEGDGFAQAVLAGKGQMLRKCALGDSKGIVSPTSSKPFSFAAKAAVGGTWLVDGKPVACSADSSFSADKCGAGWGCSNGFAPSDASHLPGLSAPGVCSVPEAGYSSGAMNLCGKTDHKGWVTYLRASP